MKTPKLIKDINDQEFWELPIGTIVEFYYYETPPEIGEVVTFEFDYNEDEYYCEVRCSNGTISTPWDRFTIHPLSKLEKAMR